MKRILETVWCERWSLEHFSLFRQPDDQREITFSLFETEVMLLAIAVNSQYSNMKNRLLRQQIEIWIATCSEQTANQNTNIACQYCKVARKRTTGFTVSYEFSNKIEKKNLTLRWNRILSFVSTAERNIKSIWTTRSLFRAAMLFSSSRSASLWSSKNQQ